VRLRGDQQLDRVLAVLRGGDRLHRGRSRPTRRLFTKATKRRRVKPEKARRSGSCWSLFETRDRRQMMCEAGGAARSRVVALAHSSIFCRKGAKKCCKKRRPNNHFRYHFY
jgi:hypothetical protein